MSDDTKKQLFALMAHAEEQQEALDKAMETITKQQEQMEKLQKSLPVLAAQLFQKSLNDARASISDDMAGHASKVAGQLKKASEEAVRASQAIKKESAALDWKHAFMVVGSITGVCLVIIIASLLWIPSLDEIVDRKATIAQLDKAGGKLQVAKCSGELCVRVMKKQCGYGKTKDYCVVDFQD